MSFVFPRSAYLAKIGLAAPSANEAGLQALHRAQCMAVAFENLNPLLGRGVSLELQHLSDKILKQGRGGYCFELNAFFLAALHEFGFEARSVLGRVFMGRPEPGPRSHQASLVELSGRTWLADVGFGGPGLVEAIPFEAGFETYQHDHKIRLRKDSKWGMAYEDYFEGAWRLIYTIADEVHAPADYQIGNHFCSTHPDTIFRRFLFCARPTPQGRITVFDRKVQLYTGEKKEERTLADVEDLRWLFDQLGISVSDEDLVALDQKLPRPEKA